MDRSEWGGQNMVDWAGGRKQKREERLEKSEVKTGRQKRENGVSNEEKLTQREMDRERVGVSWAGRRKQDS